MPRSSFEFVCQAFLGIYTHLLLALAVNLLKQEPAIRFIVVNSFWLTGALNAFLCYLYGSMVWRIAKIFLADPASTAQKFSPPNSASILVQQQPANSLSFFEVVPQRADQFFSSSESSTPQLPTDSLNNPFLDMKSTFFDRNFQFAQDSVDLDSLNKANSTGKIISISPPKTLSYFCIEESFDMMEKKLRKWISSTILSPLNQDISLIEKSLPPSSAGTSLTISSLEGFFGASLQHLSESREKLVNISSILNSHPQLTVFHSALERFFCAAKELAAGEALELFGWNKFIFPEGDKISHSELIMALFCVYLDFQMPGEDKATISTGPFSRGFFLAQSQSYPNALMHHHESLRFTGIRQTSFKPPHFDVLHKGQLYECLDGPSNVFMAILVFLSLVKREFNGYVGLLNLNGASMHHLLSVVE